MWIFDYPLSLPCPRPRGLWMTPWFVSFDNIYSRRELKKMLIEARFQNDSEDITLSIVLDNSQK